MSCLYDIPLILKDLKRHILKKKILEEPIWSFPLLNEKNTLLVMCILVIDLLFF